MSGTKTKNPPTSPQNQLPELAGMGARMAALIVDWILCVLIANGLIAIGVLPQLEFPVWPSVIFMLDYAFFIGMFGQTAGMKLAKIHCVNAADGERLGVPRALLRGLLTALVVPVLTALSDPHRRGLHDKLTGSAMFR